MEVYRHVRSSPSFFAGDWKQELFEAKKKKRIIGTRNRIWVPRREWGSEDHQSTAINQLCDIHYWLVDRICILSMHDT